MRNRWKLCRCVLEICRVCKTLSLPWVEQLATAASLVFKSPCACERGKICKNFFLVTWLRLSFLIHVLLYTHCSLWSSFSSLASMLDMGIQNRSWPAHSHAKFAVHFLASASCIQHMICDFAWLCTSTHSSALPKFLTNLRLAVWRNVFVLNATMESQ